MGHRLILVLEGWSAGPERVELWRPEKLLASAVVGGVRQLEDGGRRVLRVEHAAETDRGVIAAADLIVRLRGLTAQLTEEDLALLLELLPL